MQQRKGFAEELGSLFEGMGLPPVAGRIFAWLLICDPAHQTAAELAEAVSASKGSISTMTRLLVQFRLVERIRVPGQRSRCYRVRSGGYGELMQAKLHFTAELRRAAERGLEMLRGESPEARRRLAEFRDAYAFFERELPAMIAKYEDESGGAGR